MYAMMKQYRLVWDYMITVIGNKFYTQNFSYGQIDLNVFFGLIVPFIGTALGSAAVFFMKKELTAMEAFGEDRLQLFITTYWLITPTVLLVFAEAAILVNRKKKKLIYSIM